MCYVLCILYYLLLSSPGVDGSECKDAQPLSQQQPQPDNLPKKKKKVFIVRKRTPETVNSTSAVTTTELGVQRKRRSLEGATVSKASKASLDQHTAVTSELFNSAECTCRLLLLLHLNIPPSICSLPSPITSSSPLLTSSTPGSSQDEDFDATSLSPQTVAPQVPAPTSAKDVVVQNASQRVKTLAEMKAEM